jgi:hypothetical protein
MIVYQYGLHFAQGDVGFLLQGAGETNIISPQLRSPFILRTHPARVNCPHAIDLENVVDAPDWISDPLASCFLPQLRQPGEKAKAIWDREGKYEPIAHQLVRLSSPTQSILHPIWWRTVKETKVEYGASNLSPLIWIAPDMRHAREAQLHIQYAEAYNRRVLFICRERLPLFDDIEWINSDLSEIPSGPLEAIGAGVVRKQMYGKSRIK